VAELGEVLGDLAARLDARKIPYMVIGGLANAVWGVPRATVDIDITVVLDLGEIEALLAQLAPQYLARSSRPKELAEETHVLPLRHAGGTQVDLILAMLPFEHEAVSRAVAVEIGGTSVRFCTAEDLVLLKIVSERERDLADVEALLRRRRTEIDRSYLDPRIHELATLLMRPDLERRYLDLLKG
jgi:Nucleotidyltransferase of unknown function (DUF6036)